MTFEEFSSIRIEIVREKQKEQKINKTLNHYGRLRFLTLEFHLQDNEINTFLSPAVIDNFLIQNDVIVRKGQCVAIEPNVFLYLCSADDF